MDQWRRKMNIKNYYVSDIEAFKDKLLRELIAHNISFVVVDNEIHYNDKIIRFYEKSLKLNNLKEQRKQYRDVLIKLFLKEETADRKDYVILKNNTKFSKTDNYHKFQNYYKTQPQMRSLKKYH